MGKRASAGGCGGIPWSPCLARGRRRRVIRRRNGDRRIEGCDIRNAAQFSYRASRILVRVRPENHIASFRCGADRVELVGDQIRHRLADSTNLSIDLMRVVLCSNVLSRANRDRLSAWLNACETGKERLRAAIPAGWSVGDKTGTGQRGAVNDVALVVPPGRAPIVIAAYLSDSDSSLAAPNAAHVEISKSVVRLFLGSGTERDKWTGTSASRASRNFLGGKWALQLAEPRTTSDDRTESFFR